MSAIHADRREPAAPEGPLDLAAAGADLLGEAKSMASGRAARTLTPGLHAPLSQTLVAVRAGVELSEHDMNGPATILLLRGRVTMNASAQPIELGAGQWVDAATRHSLRADEDAVLLVTVAPTASP